MGSYNNYKMFGCFNRKFKISEREPPPDVRDAFSRYAENGPHMNAEQLARFLVEYQGEHGCTVDDAAEIIQKVHGRRHHLAKHTHRYLDLDGFFDYLFQDDLNGPLNPQVSHDMTAPLQHYFIYTGHNSYLTGNQLSSQSSERPIIRALERGVRGIELDLWPNSAKDNIQVLHGRTLTTPVTLFKCLESIKKHAFVKSPYPVIVTLEDHLTPELQAKAAEMLIEVFGEMLYCPGSQCLEELPSPEELKHRIVLSTKPPKEYLESRQQNDKETASPSGKDSSEDDSSMKETTENAAEENEAEGSNSDPDDKCSEASTSQPGGTESKCLHAGAEKTNAELQDHAEAEKTSAEQQDHAEAVKTSAEQQDHAEAEKTNAEQQDCAEAEKPNAEEQDHAEAEKPNAEEQDHAEAEKPSAEEQDHAEAEKTNAEQQDHAEAERTNAEQQDHAEAEKTNAEQQDHAEAEKTNAEQQDSDRSKNDLGDEGGDASTQSALRSGAPEYKRLIAIRAGKAKQGVKHALTTVQEKVKRLSLNEGELEKAAGSYGTDVVRFTQKSILRVFPKGTRVTSSNFKPMLGWMHGAQMVAFNMQGYGKSLWLMHGMFRANGGCGYVKKPRFLMERSPDDEVFDPKVSLPLKFTLKVSVYLGDGWRLDFSHTHFDAFSPPDFYTKLYIVGAPADCAKSKTRIIEDDWGPHWGEEFEFPLTVPELALLRIEVREYDMSEKDDFGGQTCLPVSELRPGIRSVPLHDKKGEKLKSVRLLVRFQFV